MGYAVSLSLAMGILWLVLSGHYSNPFLLCIGAGTALFSVVLAWRLHILDEEASPYHKLWRFFFYWPWLLAEVIKTNITVVRTILSPDMVLTPRMVRVKTLPRTDMARALFANSITMTPGTVSVDLDDDEIIVHVVLKEMTNKNDFAHMAARCAKACGEKGELS